MSYLRLAMLFDALFPGLFVFHCPGSCPGNYFRIKYVTRKDRSLTCAHSRYIRATI
jgi:hypothetical protein